MLELTVRLVVSLAIVVGLLLVLARLGARKFRGGTGALVHVVHRQPLSRTSAVAVVTVGSRVLVLGTTEQQVSVLAELDPDEIELDDATVLELAASDDDVPAHAFPVAELVETPQVAHRVSTGSTTGSSKHRGSHRAGKSTPKPAAPDLDGALAGSILSAGTWKQAYRAATGRGFARRAS